MRDMDDTDGIPEQLHSPHHCCQKMGCCSARSLAERIQSPTIVEARLFCVMSIVAGAITFIVGIAASVAGGSVATLSYSLESLVDAISSGLVLWRFGGSDVDSEELKLRERRCVVCIAFAFILMAAVVMATAAYHLVAKTELENDVMLMVLASFSFVTLLLIGAGQIHIAQIINSEALKHDGVSSVAGSVLSFVTFLNIIINEVSSGVWWLDPASSVLMSVGLFTYGVVYLTKDRWWTKAFWHPHWQADEEHVDEDDRFDESGISMADLTTV